MIQVTVYNTCNYEIVCRVECTSCKEAAVYEDYYTRKGFYVEVKDFTWRWPDDCCND